MEHPLEASNLIGQLEIGRNNTAKALHLIKSELPTSIPF